MWYNNVLNISYNMEPIEKIAPDGIFIIIYFSNNAVLLWV